MNNYEEDFYNAYKDMIENPDDWINKRVDWIFRISNKSD